MHPIKRTSREYPESEATGIEPLVQTVGGVSPEANIEIWSSQMLPTKVEHALPP